MDIDVAGLANGWEDSSLSNGELKHLDAEQTDNVWNADMTIRTITTLLAVLWTAMASAQDARSIRLADLCRIKGNSLSNQLNIVARLIKANLGTKRQVFFVSLGGFDHHDGLLERQTTVLKSIRHC